MGIFSFLGKKKSETTVNPTTSPVVEKPTEQLGINDELCDTAMEAYRAKDYDTANGIWRTLAEKGMARAQNAIGVAYKNGTGVEQDYAEAVKWYKLAAAQGYDKAMYNLGFSYDLGKGVERNRVIAANWYEGAAKLGHSRAAAYIGLAYEEGDGREKNLEEALKWYQIAVDRGDVVGIRYLAAMYSNGKGVAQNKEEAFRLHSMAAGMGDGVSMYNLAVCYYNGEGIEKDWDKALEWANKAKENGYTDGERVIGWIEEERENAKKEEEAPVNVQEPRRISKKIVSAREQKKAEATEGFALPTGSRPDDIGSRAPGMLSVGDEFQFGRYYQSEWDGFDTDIDWKVLECRENCMLVISKYAILLDTYKSDFKEATWETSWLRHSLNRYFMEEAFDEEEQKCIALTEVVTADNPDYHTTGGNTVSDHIFILSMEEAMKYFTEDGKEPVRIEWAEEEEQNGDPNNMIADIREDCEYEGADGWYFYDLGGRKASCHPTSKVARLLELKRQWNETYVPWWLRTSGVTTEYAAVVLGGGRIDSFGEKNWEHWVSVRPAMWIYTKK